jgi:hypothetical protein
MGILFLPFFQSYFTIFNFKPLHGAYENIDKPELKWFTWKSWFNEKFQTNFNKSIEANFGFRNFLIRLNNQIDYSFFKKSNAKNVVVGLSDCLYEEGYILDYTGKNFAGADSLDRVLKRTKELQDFLKKNKNIDLIIVFEPGKASYFPEFIPNRYKPKNKSISNYEYLSNKCKLLNINHLDLNAWFKTLKDTSQFPLFPKYGVHWSTYGMYLATDTLLKFIEKTRNIDIVNFHIKKINATNKIKDADFDIEQTLNLLFQLPHETMAYPEIVFDDSLGKLKPNVLTIADSYYWSIFNSKIPDKVFNKHEFWYYNTTIYPDIWGENAKYVDHTKDKENIEKYDIILLMTTELNTSKPFFGFIENVYNIYFKQAN